MFGAWTHRPNDRVTLETGLVLQFSRITQDGEGAHENDFLHPKPHAALAFQRSASDQFTLLVERRVSQLDFEDFATSTSRPAGWSGSPCAGHSGRGAKQTLRSQIREVRYGG
ncbi:MAG: hypothetical protein ACOC05_09925 [Oceanicaulis sp.]